jgi:hypothetical protein
MYPVPGKCPVCGQELSVTRLHCRSCDSTLEGHFELGCFHQLSPDQLHFVETFIRCEGKLNKVQEEVKLSYPTVRSRLLDVIRALGYEVQEEPTLSPEQRKVILDDLAQGKISSEEAIGLLQGD